jgi:hypothetical protein
METVNYKVGDQLEIVSGLEIYEVSIEKVLTNGILVLDQKVYGRKRLQPLDLWTTKGFQKGNLGTKNIKQVSLRKKRFGRVD